MSKELQQINISYLPAEDRLLLKVRALGTTEYRVWLTRRFTGLLIDVLLEQIDKEGGIQELSSSRTTLGLLKGGAFEQAYNPPPEQDYPLGEAGVLGYRINVARNETGTVSLQLLPEQGAGLNIALDKAMLFMLFNLLEQGLANTGWDLRMPHAGPHSVH